MNRFFQQVLFVVALLFALPHPLGRCIELDDTLFTRPSSYLTVCSCRCCFQGDCVAISNATRDVPSCEFCTVESCVNRLSELDNLWSSSAVAGKRIRKPACVVLSMTESQMCGGDPKCKRFTSIQPKCVDRGAFFQKYSCIFWLCCVSGLVVVGLYRKVATALSRPQIT